MAAKGNTKDLVDSVLNESDEELRQNSIFHIMRNQPERAIITGAAIRKQEFKKGVTTMIDLRIVTEDERIVIVGLPQFARFAFNDAARILKKHEVIIKKMYPEGMKANLKDYGWIATPQIPVVLTPNEYNGKVWVGRIKEIPIPTESDSNLLDALEETEEVQA
jgi:hypothetical protein